MQDHIRKVNITNGWKVNLSEEDGS
jgi:hypothetical protein